MQFLYSDRISFERCFVGKAYLPKYIRNLWEPSDAC